MQPVAPSALVLLARVIDNQIDRARLGGPARPGSKATVDHAAGGESPVHGTSSPMELGQKEDGHLTPQAVLRPELTRHRRDGPQVDVRSGSKAETGCVVTLTQDSSMSEAPVRLAALPQTHGTAQASFDCIGRWRPRARQLRSDEPRSRPCPLRSTFDRFGGMVTDEQLVGWLRDHSPQPVSRLARAIVDRSVVSFECSGQRWLPLFQFDMGTLCVRREVSLVVAELRETLDDAALVSWFAEQNAWLGEAAPVEALDTQPHAVLNAARADRFITRW